MSTIFITGAKSGIGAATAALFESKGWNVFATGRAECNVNDTASIASAVARCIEQYGCIDVLVNNAGVYSTYPLEYTSAETISSIINTNICGTIDMIKAVLPYMRKNNGGMIINVSSIAGQTASPYLCVYNASKWAIEGLSESLIYELSGLGIKVKCVEPGIVKTPLYRNLQKPEQLEGYPRFNNVFNFMHNAVNKAYGAEIPAATIYQAATDGKNKPRYKSGYDTKALLFLRSLLPLGLFQAIVRKVMGA